MSLEVTNHSRDIIDKQAAVNQQLRTGHITAQLITGQKHSRAGQIRRHAGAAQRNPPLNVRPLGVVGQVLLVQLRADRARQQGVAPDAVPAQRHGRALHQAEDAGLGRRVVRLLPAADERGHGRHADDAAPGGGLVEGHLARSGLRHVEGAVEVGADRRLQQVGRQRHEVGKGADAGVGDADVEASGARDGRRHEPGRRLGVFDVAGLVGQPAGGRGGPAGIARREGFRLGHQRVEVVPVLVQPQVVDHHVGALAQEPEADGAAYARRPARDDGRLAGQQPGQRHLVKKKKEKKTKVYDARPRDPLRLGRVVFLLTPTQKLDKTSGGK
ncbi:hypothetical protein MAC_00780 [Metarhizium acridum CQMa 102]|uniref:Uncharacterized protein n=1 Tax=Metarhizium acridum (strain CQMa 102) TaxID=655827 RepID=E9DTE2_METAQ|nr:uncharacterized protein MAC_00780 [Metarhizium acridum CQMa 102]EFY92997.1 hypothetical protein MAC_00780 [Metarhizium acridum CQMa 102]